MLHATTDALKSRSRNNKVLSEETRSKVFGKPDLVKDFEKEQIWKIESYV